MCNQQSASQLYVARMKTELANALADRDKLTRQNEMIKEHLRESEKAIYIYIYIYICIDIYCMYVYVSTRAQTHTRTHAITKW